MKRLLAVAALAIMCLAFSRVASASIVDCNTDPSQCTTFNTSVAGGANPYVYIQDAYFADTSNTYFDPANPTQITYNFNNGAVMEQATGSLATGITGVFAEGITSGDTVSVAANDIFTLVGPAGGPVDITATFTAAGTATLAPVASNSPLVGGGNAQVELCGPGGSFACGGDSFNLGGIPFAGYSGPVFSENTGQPSLTRQWTFSESAGDTFNIYYDLSAQVAAGSTIDLYDPGQLSFILPDGYSIESASGFESPVSTSATPEPRSLGLLALVLTVLAGRWMLGTKRTFAKR